MPLTLVRHACTVATVTRASIAERLAIEVLQAISLLSANADKALNMKGGVLGRERLRGLGGLLEYACMQLHMAGLCLATAKCEQQACSYSPIFLCTDHLNKHTDNPPGDIIESTLEHPFLVDLGTLHGDAIQVVPVCYLQSHLHILAHHCLAKYLLTQHCF